jgi:threonine synthase
MLVVCTNCQSPYPEVGTPYLCRDCGGVYDFAADIQYEPRFVEPGGAGIWRYRHTFGIPEHDSIAYLGEGDTPLIHHSISGKSVYFKLEYLNPTGSFKDRGAAVLTSFLQARGAASVIEDSSGNAGASLAAYAAHMGMEAKIFVPAYASGPKREQINRYGAEIVTVEGPRSNCAEVVQQETSQGGIYASHVFLPHGILGFATVAYEITNQLGQVPGVVILPVGHGSLLLGVHRGFVALLRAEVIAELPLIIGVQAQRCAPLWLRYKDEHAYREEISEGETIAEGVRIVNPVRVDAVMAAVKEASGWFEIVPEEEIMPSRNELAALGFYVEPTSAIVWHVVSGVINQVNDPVVAVLTGSGFKHR